MAREVVLFRRASAVANHARGRQSGNQIHRNI